MTLHMHADLQTSCVIVKVRHSQGHHPESSAVTIPHSQHIAQGRLLRRLSFWLILFHFCEGLDFFLRVRLSPVCACLSPLVLGCVPLSFPVHLPCHDPARTRGLVCCFHTSQQGTDTGTQKHRHGNRNTDADLCLPCFSGSGFCPVSVGSRLTAAGSALPSALAVAAGCCCWLPLGVAVGCCWVLLGVAGCRWLYPYISYSRALYGRALLYVLIIGVRAGYRVRLIRAPPACGCRTVFEAVGTAPAVRHRVRARGAPEPRTR
jgi:hypothetical protein